MVAAEKPRVLGEENFPARRGLSHKKNVDRSVPKLSLSASVECEDVGWERPQGGYVRHRLVSVEPLGALQDAERQEMSIEPQVPEQGRYMEINIEDRSRAKQKRQATRKRWGLHGLGVHEDRGLHHRVVRPLRTVPKIEELVRSDDDIVSQILRSRRGLVEADSLGPAFLQARSNEIADIPEERPAGATRKHTHLQAALARTLGRFARGKVVAASRARRIRDMRLQQLQHLVRCTAGPPLGHAVVYEVREWVHARLSYVGITAQIIGSIEQWPRIATFADSAANVVSQRIDVGSGDVVVALQIVRGVEECSASAEMRLSVSDGSPPLPG